MVAAELVHRNMASYCPQSCSCNLDLPNCLVQRGSASFFPLTCKDACIQFHNEWVDLVDLAGCGRTFHHSHTTIKSQSKRLFVQRSYQPCKDAEIKSMQMAERTKAKNVEGRRKE